VFWGLQGLCLAGMQGAERAACGQGLDRVWSGAGITDRGKPLLVLWIEFKLVFLHVPYWS
jgi:hypothetical protein